MRQLISFFLLLAGTLPVSAQQGIHFLNESGRQVLVQKRTILEEGAYPHVIDSNYQQFQTIPLQIDQPVILNVSVVPLKGPYGTADGLYFLFKPGDSLVIKLSKSQKADISHLTNTKRTEELRFFPQHLANIKSTLPYQLFGFNGNQSLHKQIWSDNLKRRDKVLDSLYRPYINSIREMLTNADTDAEKWYYFYLGSLIADKLFVGYKVEKGLQSSLHTFYKDSLDKWRRELTGKECQNIRPYNDAVYAIYQQQFGQLTASRFIDTVAALAKGSNKNFVVSRYVSENMGKSNDAEQLMEQYKEVCDDSIYQGVVIGNYLLRKRQSKAFANEAAVLFKSDKAEVGFTQVIAALKGKVVYVDFWASWCKPCIEELPYSHQLKEKLNGKDVEFLYISIDDDFDSWQKAAARYNVAGVNSYMMPAADKTALAKQIDLGPIPRYLLIDKEGKIVNLNAPRPSDTETYDLLLKTVK